MKLTNDLDLNKLTSFMLMLAESSDEIALKYFSK